MNREEIQQEVYDYAEMFQDPDPETARLLDLLGAALTDKTDKSERELSEFFKAMKE